MTRVVVAASSDVARAGLDALLASVPGIAVVDRASTPSRLASAIRSADPDAVVVDLEQDDDASLALYVAAAEAADGPPTVVLADAPVEPRVTDGRRHRGFALLPRRATAAEIDAAIRAAAAGLHAVHPDVAFGAAHAARSGDTAALTPRELEVLRMLAGGLPNKAIARALRVSAHTVKFHVGSIMAKLQSASRTEAVTEGIRRGLIYV